MECCLLQNLLGALRLKKKKIRLKKKKKNKLSKHPINHQSFYYFFIQVNTFAYLLQLWPIRSLI